MAIKHLVVLLASALALASPSAFSESKERVPPFVYVPPDGFVPDAETAVKISEIILDRIYGQTEIDMEKPLKTTLVDGVWIVKGTMLPGMLGGVAELHINKKDGMILFLSHGM